MNDMPKAITGKEADELAELLGLDTPEEKAIQAKVENIQKNTKEADGLKVYDFVPANVGSIPTEEHKANFAFTPAPFPGEVEKPIEMKEGMLTNTGDVISKEVADQMIKNLSDAAVEKVYSSIMGNPKLSHLTKDQITEIVRSSAQEVVEPDYIPTAAEIAEGMEGEVVDVLVDEAGRYNNVVPGYVASNHDSSINNVRSLIDGISQKGSDTEVNITPEAIQEYFTEMQFSELPLEDAIVTAHIIREYAKSNRKTGLYKSCPYIVKTAVEAYAAKYAIGNMPANTVRNTCAASLFNDIINRCKVDDVIIDLNSAIDSIISEMNAGINDTMTSADQATKVKFIKKLEQDCESEKDPETAARLKECHRLYVEACELREFGEYCTKHRVKPKMLSGDKPDTKFFRRACEDWNNKFSKNKLVSKKADDMCAILKSMFEDTYGADVCRRFIVCYIDFTQNMQPGTAEQYFFMYNLFDNIVVCQSGILDGMNKDTFDFTINIKFRIEGILRDMAAYGGVKIPENYVVSEADRKRYDEAHKEVADTPAVNS